MESIIRLRLSRRKREALHVSSSPWKKSSRMWTWTTAFSRCRLGNRKRRSRQPEADFISNKNSQNLPERSRNVRASNDIMRTPVMHKSMRCFVAVAMSLMGWLLLEPTTHAQEAKFDSDTISGLGARNIGSAAMSGRVAAIAAVKENGRLTVY